MEPIKILLIDDEQSTYDIVNHYCKKNKKYSVNLQWLDEVPEDVSNINIKNYELLLLDYHINDSTGLEMLKLLEGNKTDEADELNLPVIMLSSLDDIQLAAEIIHYGVSEFIPKMNLSEELLNSKINDVIDKTDLKQQLHQANKQLKDSVIKLRKQNEEINNFYQIISHELKTPLTSIGEFVAIMLDGIAGELTEDQHEYLTICKRNCSQLAQYINDLLEIGRISTGKYILNKSIIDVNKAIADVINTCQILANEKQIRIQSDIFSSDIQLEADEIRVYQAILILINNAIKFSPNNSTITIRVINNPSQNMIDIAVIDSGCGIEPEHQELIFDRLYQTNTTNVGANAGLGLGLHICREIARLHDGDIGVESEPGNGSTFTLKFPYTNNSK